jgi:hypothetical protein
MRKAFLGERFSDGDRPADKEAIQIVEHGGDARDREVVPRYIG